MIDFNSQLAIIPRVYETAQLQDDLEHSGGVTISWKSAESTEIPLGSYITYKGMRYILLEPYAPSKSGIHYQYSPMFKHPQNMLDRVPFWITSRDADGNIIHLSTTSFTGTPFIIIKKICDFMAEYANEMQDDFFAETVGLELTDPTQPWNASTNPWKATWTFDDTKITETSKTIITVGFDGSSLKSAADAIASAMGCNLYWDWSVKKLMFISGTTITGDSYNCFHVLGGTTNMGKNTVSGGYAAVTQRLTLNTAQYPGSIIDCRPVDEHGNHYGIRLTKDLILDDIYPKMELYIKTARERLCILTDNETGDFIVDHFEYFYMDGGTKKYSTLDHTTGGKYYDAQGHELTRENVYKTFAKWYLTFMKADGTDYTVDPRTILINDQPLGILFQLDLQDTTKMSSLVGNQFNATYFPAADDEWDKNDAKDDRTLRPSDEPWHINAGEYYINFEAEGEIILPTTSKIVGGIETGLVPEVGKKVTLVNVALTTEEATAKEELLDAAMEIIGLMNTPAGEYSEPVIFAEPISGVQPPHTIEPKMVGDVSPFGNTHGPVVTNVDLNIDTNEATVTVGSWSRKTKTGGTADKVETVSVSAASATNGSDPYSTGDLGEGHYVPKTSSSSQTTIAQTQVKPSGAFVVSLTPDNQTIDCNASGIVKTTKNIYIQIAAYYGSRDVTAGCRVAYTQALPQNVTMHLETSSSGTSGASMAINTDYDLTNGLDWLRINIPQGANFSTLSGVLARTLYITHSAYGSRNAAITISGIYDGAAGMAGAFKSRVFARTNTDISRVRPTGGDYDHPWVGGENPCTQSYIIDEQTGQTVSVTWSDGIPSGDAKLWSTVRTFLASGTSGAWSNPAQETDTATLDLEFSPNATCPANAPVGTAAERNNPSTKAQRHQDGWYDPSDELPQGNTWEDMIWRAERAIVNGVYSGEWVITRIKGEAGERGGNTATVPLYKRSSSAINTVGITIPLYYKFEKDANGKNLFTDEACTTPFTDQTSGGNGWSPTIPSGTDPIYITNAIAFNTAESDEIGTTEWVTPVKYTENGVNGSNGINAATVFLYQRSASAPTGNTLRPSDDIYYKFADGKLYTDDTLSTEVQDGAAVLCGWQRAFPASNGQPCWVIQAAALSADAYDEIEDTEWSTPVQMVKDGTDASSNVSSITSALGEIGKAYAVWAQKKNRDCKVTLSNVSAGPAGASVGDICYLHPEGTDTKIVQEYTSSGWQNATQGARAGAFETLAELLGWNTSFYLRKSMDGTHNEYDIYTQNASFTDKFTGRTVSGNAGVWVYYNNLWNNVIDNVTSLLKDYGDNIVNAVFGSASTVPGGASNFASALTIQAQMAALYSSMNTQDGENALAALMTIVKMEDGKPTSEVWIRADKINFDAYSVNVKGTFQSADKRVLIAKDMNGYNTVSIEILDSSKTHPVVGIYADHNNHPTMEFDPSTNGTVITDTYVQTKQYKVWDAANQYYIAGYNGSFVAGNYTIYVVNGIITEVRSNS